MQDCVPLGDSEHWRKEKAIRKEFFGIFLTLLDKSVVGGHKRTEALGWEKNSPHQAQDVINMLEESNKPQAWQDKRSKQDMPSLLWSHTIETVLVPDDYSKPSSTSIAAVHYVNDKFNWTTNALSPNSKLFFVTTEKLQKLKRQQNEPVI